jgi:hypothetical protein
MVTIVLVHVNMIRLPHHDIDMCTSFSSCQEKQFSFHKKIF